MIEDDSMPKAYRILKMAEILINNGSFVKSDLAEKFHVDKKTIQRDINVLKYYFETLSENYKGTLYYDKKEKCYKLKHIHDDELTKNEIFAICKILLESRALNVNEMNTIIEKLEKKVYPKEDEKLLKYIIGNEKLNYMEVKHRGDLINILWKLSYAVKKQFLINVKYRRADGSVVERTLEPVGVMFSDFYFYLIAYLKGKKKDYPAIYRVDRIVEWNITEEHFKVEYNKRFEDIEFRKRIQFMQGGNIQTIKFKFWGESLEAVLDRLPTAEILEKKDGKAIIKAEIYGRGIKMWLLSQMQFLEVMEPKEFREEMKDTIEQMLNNYI